MRHVCTKCERELSSDAFSPDNRKASGLQSQCKDCRRIRQREYRKKHPERHKASLRRSYRKHRDRRIAEVLEYERRNKQEVRERKRRYYEANREKVHARNNRWRAANRDRARAYKRNYDHRKRTQTEQGLSADGWLDIVSQFGSRCAYCMTRPDVLEMDHLVPVSAGGGHDVDNVVPACRFCNRSKKDRALLHWLLIREGAV